MSDKLLPCPFCGNKRIEDALFISEKWPLPEKSQWLWRISCGNCSFLIEGNGPNPDHLINYWNMRLDSADIARIEDGVTRVIRDVLFGKGTHESNK